MNIDNSLVMTREKVGRALDEWAKRKSGEKQGSVPTIKIKLQETEYSKCWRSANVLLGCEFLQKMDHVSFTFIFLAPSTSTVKVMY